MKRMMCDIAGCDQEGELRLFVTQQIPRARQFRAEREGYDQQGTANLGQIDVCNAHVATLSLAELYERVNVMILEGREGENRTNTAQGLGMAGDTIQYNPVPAFVTQRATGGF